MPNKDDIADVIQYVLKFGEIAVRKGFVSIHQLKEALDEQISNEPCVRLRPHKPIGEIFLEKGLMTPGQIETVLEEIYKKQAGDKIGC